MARTKRTDVAKVVGYIRVSTEDQQLSPEGQRASLERWCRDHGAELVAVHTDHGISGGAAIADRPGLVAALADLRTFGAGVLLAAKRDRIARDTMTAAMLEREAERIGATIRTVDGVGDGEGPEAMLMRRMVDAFAEYERLLIRARTRAAMAVKRSRGERTSLDAPYGKQIADDGRTLEANPDEARVVELVRAYRAEGLTLRAIAARLEGLGLVPRGGRSWHPQTVANIAAAA